jgi:YD repeat-containing protein
MSEVAPFPPPPIGPAGNNPLLIPAVVIAALILLGLFGSFELRLLNSKAGKEAAQRIRQDPRVRAEFGNDVHIPFALAWDSGDQAEIYALVSGSEAHGYAVVDLLKLQNDWLISGLQINDKTEGHILTLSTSSTHSTPAPREQLQGPYTLYFVALGDAAQPDVDDLVGFFQSEFGISAKTLPAITLPAYTYDAHRKQRVAELSGQAMESKYPEMAADPEARVIGILDDDLYIREYNWAYTYSYRRGCCKDSVIPTVRLDPAFYHFPPNASIRRERLRKVAMKAVGLLYLGFKESSDPQSVDAVEASVEDIDRMGTIYLASDVQTRVVNSAADGRPCLTFYSSTVAGSAVRNPIVPCLQQDQNSEGTQYQIDLVQGRFELTRNDLYRGGAIPLVLQRMHFSHHFDDKVRALGKDSWQNLDDSVWSADPNSIQTINIDGTRFQRMTPGTGFSPDARYRGAADGSNFSSGLLSWENGGWRIDTGSGEVWRYLGCTANSRVQCYYMGHRNFRGDNIEIKRDPTSGHIQQVRQKTNNDLPEAAALDHTWTPLYDGDKIIEIHDSDGRIARYRYDQQQYLTDVEADSHTIHHDYDEGGRITGVVEDGRSLRIHYDSEGRPDRVDFPNGFAYSIKYSQDGIELDVPGKSYMVTVLPTFFRIVERGE